MVVAANIKNLDDLSLELGVSSQQLFALIHSADNLYQEISLPKRKPGEFRKIKIPSAELKGVQRIILQSILNQQELHEAAFAYRQKLSVVDAARKLCGKKAILKVDIKDFFPSISAARVNGIFQGIGFEKNVSWMLTRLTTYKGKLCQGSPTSPYLSNLACRNLDMQLDKLAATWGCGYIRYSDDMFFYKPSNFNSEKLLTACRKVLTHNSFAINKTKCKSFHKDMDKVILGLNVSRSTPELPQSQRKNMRSSFHRATTDTDWAIEKQSFLSGLLQWYRCVYGKNETFFRYKMILDSIARVRKHKIYYSS
tara:strand:- start:519 stop:1448 length:930 start_codon:yes stop_codon:yes gene_type:complete